MPTTIDYFQGLAQDRRFDAVHHSGMLDSGPEPEFDALTRLASRVLRTPVVLISLVDENRQYFKSQIGLPAPSETPHTHSFCQHVQVTGFPLIVQDARTHPLVYNNGAIPDLGVIAYAGVPLSTNEGCLGAFCAIDSQPREWTESDLDVLQTIAAHVSKEFNFRSAARRLEGEVDLLHKQEEVREAHMRYTIHDLRTPLSAMIMSMDLMAADPLTEDQAEFLELAQSTGNLLLGMIGSLLGSEDQEEGPVLFQGAYDVPDLMERAIEQVRTLALKKEITLTMDALPGLPQMVADGEKILRIFVNFLGNALKFTPAGGQVTLGCTLVDNAFQFSVADTGPGFPPEEVERIFQPGVKLDKASSHLDSTGLGLAFCKEAVIAHGGRIWAETSPGKGSRFCFTIPVSG